MSKDGLYYPTKNVAEKSYFRNLSEYQALYKESITNPEQFWGRLANELLVWEQPFRCVQYGNFQSETTAGTVWFPEGRLNACYNALDRHAMADPERIALIWEQDEPDKTLKYTYAEVLRHTCQLANYMKSKLKVKPGDCVTIYMPMIPAAIFSILACARIGAVHNVVFAGFSVDALRERIEDSQSKVLITADHGKRGGKLIYLKKIAREAVAAKSSCVETVIVFKHSGQPIIGDFDEIKDVWWDEAVSKMPSYCPCEPMSAEDPLFILYTSGSTGKPKGVVHTTGGYLLGTLLSFKYAFDYKPGDIYACVADIGWITGHSYILYGPFLAGATSVLFEPTPLYPRPDRYWDMVEKLKVTQFYTSPTAVRTLRKLGDEHVKKHDLSSLRVLGSVGEPMNPDAWKWFYEVVGNNRCSIVDTYWQTETGSFILLPLPGCAPSKAGAACFPFFGMDVAILDPNTGKELLGNGVTGILAIKSPWPSCARTIFNNHERYLAAYFHPYPGYYFTGDGATRDQDGYYWINGRVDDVINVSGHRLSTAEIENALAQNNKVAESAVVGINDEMTGQAICCFVVLKSHETNHPEAIVELRIFIRSAIGPFATPKFIYICPDLPKTRSGKLVRRILRKIGGGDVTGKESEQELGNILGDLTTLADPSIITQLVQIVNNKAHI